MKNSSFSISIAIFIATVTQFVFMNGCTKSDEGKEAATAENSAASKGIGPVSEIKLAALSPEMARKGQDIFKAKCSACHKIEEKFVGPALKGVTTRRQPEWIMNMILNPAEMVQKDPIAKELLAEFLTQMSFQNVTQDEARLILEYFREIDSKK